MLLLSPVVFGILMVNEPSTYGKLHNPRRSLFGPLVSARWCWTVFESPNLVWVFVALWDRPLLHLSPPGCTLLLWFLIHYVHRCIFYPLNMSQHSKFPIGIMLFTLPYCIANGYLQAYGLTRFGDFPYRWFRSGTFKAGWILMLAGFTLGYLSDRSLQRLKRTTGTYQIPSGGWFDLVSCPHYLGEILEWAGFCVACHGSLASLSFVVWTAANLVPRALHQHRWYQQKFEDYPPDRMALVPLLL